MDLCRGRGAARRVHDGAGEARGAQAGGDGDGLEGEGEDEGGP